MGWFSNIVLGKQPQVSDRDSPQEQVGVSMEQEIEADPHRMSSGAKVMPEVVVDKVEPHPSADMKHLELWVQVHNRSPFEVEIRRFEILGQTSDPGRYLRPDERYEIKVYSGDTPQDDHDKKVLIQYKIVENCDYFQSDHHLSYKCENFEQVDYYLPCELRLQGPIHDL